MNDGAAACGPSADMKILPALDPTEQSDYFFEKYLQTCIKNPMLVIKMFVVKLKNFWFFREGIGTEYSPAIKAWIPLYKGFYLVMLSLSLFFLIKGKKDALVIFSIPVALSLFHAVFYVETRHRVMIEPVLLYMAVCAIFILTSSFEKKIR